MVLLNNKNANQQKSAAIPEIPKPVVEKGAYTRQCIQLLREPENNSHELTIKPAIFTSNCMHLIFTMYIMMCICYAYDACITIISIQKVFDFFGEYFPLQLFYFMCIFRARQRASMCMRANRLSRLGSLPNSCNSASLSLSLCVCFSELRSCLLVNVCAWRFFDLVYVPWRKCEIKVYVCESVCGFIAAHACIQNNTEYIIPYHRTDFYRQNQYVYNAFI